MRFEAKNKEIKSYTTDCFKNVPLSVSIKHQLSLCFHLANHSFLYAGDEILGGMYVVQKCRCLFVTCR